MTNKKISKGKKKANKQQAAPPPQPTPAARAACFVLKSSGPGFAAGCPFELQSGDGEQKMMSVPLVPASLESLLSWFSKGSGTDPAAHLVLGTPQQPAGKGDRALVHSIVEAHFSSDLETVSSGVGDNRMLSVYRRGHAPKPSATDVHRAQGARLYKLAREAGLLSYSQDELAERLATDSLPDDLKRVWEQQSAQQLALEALLAAATANDASAVKKLCARTPGVASTAHIDTSELPLQAAARANCGAAIRALVEAGANLEARDNTGRTALKVARTFESTEAEAALLQLGAHDSEAGSFPIPAPNKHTDNATNGPVPPQPGPSTGSGKVTNGVSSSSASSSKNDQAASTSNGSTAAGSGTSNSDAAPAASQAAHKGSTQPTAAAAAAPAPTPSSSGGPGAATEPPNTTSTEEKSRSGAGKSSSDAHAKAPQQSSLGAMFEGWQLGLNAGRGGVPLALGAAAFVAAAGATLLYSLRRSKA